MLTTTTTLAELRKIVRQLDQIQAAYDARLNQTRRRSARAAIAAGCVKA